MFPWVDRNPIVPARPEFCPPRVRSPNQDDFAGQHRPSPHQHHRGYPCQRAAVRAVNSSAPPGALYRWPQNQTGFELVQAIPRVVLWGHEARRKSARPQPKPAQQRWPPKVAPAERRRLLSEERVEKQARSESQFDLPPRALPLLYLLLLVRNDSSEC